MTCAQPRLSDLQRAALDVRRAPPRRVAGGGGPRGRCSADRARRFRRDPTSPVASGCGCRRWTRDADRTGLGRLGFFNDCVRYASNRLRIRDLLQRHPEILEVRIDRPHHRRRAAAVGHDAPGQPHRRRPAPAVDAAVGELRAGARPPRASAARRRRPALAGGASEAWEAMQLTLPHLSAMHPMHPDHVHEELELELPGLLELHARSGWPGARSGATTTCHTTRPRTTRYLRTVLQILQWTRPRRALGAQVSAAPRAAGPAARHVPRRHRGGDPSRPGLGRAIGGHHDDVRGADELPAPEAGLLHRLLVRPDPTVARGLGPRPPSRSRSIGPSTCYFHEFMRDEMATVERIYDVAGLPMTDEARGQITAYRDAHRRGLEGQVRLRPAGRFRRRPRRRPRGPSASTSTGSACAVEVP